MNTLEEFPLVMTQNPNHVAPELKGYYDAFIELRQAGVGEAEMQRVIGMGHRHGYNCKPDDTIFNKYRAGAISMVGVMGSIYGSDSPQHHAGTALTAQSVLARNAHRDDDYNALRELVRSSGTVIASTGTLSPTLYYDLDGDVWVILSHTQIQWCGRRTDWEMPSYAVAI